MRANRGGWSIRRASTAIVLASAMLLTGAANAAVRSEKVVGGPGNQFWPSSNGQHVAFGELRHRRFDVYVSRLGRTTRTRINANDEQAVLGTLVEGTDQVVFQQYRRHRSDLYVYDISSRRRWLVPTPVRSDKWEFWPAASRELILFLRYFGGRREHRELLLYDRLGGDVRVLIGNTGGKTIFPGFAGTRYVAWTTCGAETCSIWYFDTQTDTMEKLPLPDGKAHYAPAIDEAAGAIYFVQSSANGCGRNVTLRRSTIGSASTTALATFPRTMDTGWTLGLTLNEGTGYQDLYYQRYDCGRKSGDVFRFVSVDAPGAATGEAHHLGTGETTSGSRPPEAGGGTILRSAVGWHDRTPPSTASSTASIGSVGPARRCHGV